MRSLLSIFLAVFLSVLPFSCACGEEGDPIPGDVPDPPENGEGEPDPLQFEDFLPLLINEVDLEAEFIELWNSGELSIPLAEVSFSELSGSTSKFYPVTDFSDAEAIEPQAFIVISLSRKLNNGGELITLTWRGEEFSSLTVPSSVSGKSFSRQMSGSYIWMDPSPGIENPEEETGGDGDGDGDSDGDPGGGSSCGLLPPAEHELPLLLLNEIDLEAEFIEIWNTSPSGYDLSTFQFSELSGGEEVRRSFSEFSENLCGESNGFLVLSMSGKLNNSGETVRLYSSPESLSPFAEIVIPASKEGESYSLLDSGLYEFTDTPTPGVQNVPHSPGGSSGHDSSSNKGSKFTTTTATNESVPRKDVRILISEVAFDDPSGDRIELFCADCGKGIDVKGYQLFDDKVFFEFPLETFFNTGEYIVLSLKSATETREKTGYGWSFSITHKGLTGTDETLMLLDSANTIEDAVCWGNYNEVLSPGEDEDLRFMRGRLEWGTDLDCDFQCFPSGSVKGKESMARKTGEDSNTKNDFFPNKEPAFGAPNPPSPKSSADGEIVISAIEYLPNGSGFVSLNNSGASDFPLSGYTMRSGEAILMELTDESIPPQGEFSLFLRKLPSKDIVLSLNDAWGTTEDFLCINPSENDKNSSYLLSLKRQSQWNDRNYSSCLTGDFSEGGLVKRMSEKDTNAAADFSVSPLTVLSMDESPSLFVKDILPNPEGKDKDGEWFRISTRNDAAQTKNWHILINGKEFLLPERMLENGDVMKISSGNSELKNLANESGEMILVSPSGDLYGIEWENAPEGASLRNEGSGYAWTGGKQKEKNEKKESEPTVDVLFSEEDHSLVFSGFVSPHSRVRLLIRPGNFVLTGMSDNKGRFSLLCLSQIPAGEYTVDLTTTNEDGTKVLLDGIQQFHLPAGFRMDEIFLAEIVSALPNPKGKDSGNETVIIRNVSGKSGYLRGWLLGNGKRTVEIPETFFEENETITLTGEVVPNLKNKDGIVRLLNASKEVVDELLWGKARDDELITKNGTILPPKKNKGKSSRGKTREKDILRMIYPEKEKYVEGRITRFSAESISVVIDNGREITYRFDDRNPQNDYFLSHSLQREMPIGLHLNKDREIISLSFMNCPYPVENELSPVFLTSRIIKIISLFFLVIIDGVGFFIGLSSRKDQLPGKSACKNTTEV